MTIELGRLEKVELRNAWANEATHFTPWLAQEENLALLSEAIGINLELEATEQSVGPFSADILCKDIDTDHLVLIENQLERTDHRHLGQLLTYAAGLQAVTIVWIANPFTEEHRAALDWLNQITDSRFNFFGLEVELWRIGDSPFAPKFNIVCKPNDWSKTVSEGVNRVEREALTEARQLQLEFWTHFVDFVKTKQTPIRPINPRPKNWMHMSIGRGGSYLTAIASTWNTEREGYDGGEIRAEAVIRQDFENGFARLLSERAQIEQELGYPVSWDNDETKQSRKVSILRTVDLADKQDWDNQSAWLLSHLEDLYRVVGGRIRSWSTR